MGASPAAGTASMRCPNRVVVRSSYDGPQALHWSDSSQPRIRPPCVGGCVVEASIANSRRPRYFTEVVRQRVVERSGLSVYDVPELVRSRIPKSTRYRLAVT